MSIPLDKTFKNDYLLYARKSTDDKENQKNSLSYQISEGIKYAKANNLSIAHISIPGFSTMGEIKERHTGFKEDEDFSINENGTVSYRIERPKFHWLVKYLKEGSFKGVIFLCWDRASRNKNDDSLLRKLMNQCDIHFVQTQYDYKSSSGQLHMDIDGTFAQHYSRVMSEKIRNQNRKLREEGACLYKAPIGYLNEGNSQHKPFDPIRAPIIKNLFEMYAEGTWTLRELSEWTIKQGLTMPPIRRKRTSEEMLSDEEIEIEPSCHLASYKNIQFILTNRFYIGKIRDKDNDWRDSISHEPLIPKELFYRVQDVLRSKKVSVYYIEKAYFPYRGIVRCTHCKRVYTPYEQKGIHYYGVRCEKGCANQKRNISTRFIEDMVGKALSELNFTEEELEEINFRKKSDLPRLEERRLKDLEQKEYKKRKLREDLAYLHSNKLSLLKSSVYTPDAFLEEEQKLNKELFNLQMEEQASDIAMHEVIKDLLLLSELLKDAYLYYYKANSNEKKNLIQKVFSELSFDGNMLQYKAKNGFKLLESHSVSLGGDYTWISEAVRCHQLIKCSIEDLKSLSPPD